MQNERRKEEDMRYSLAYLLSFEEEEEEERLNERERERKVEVFCSVSESRLAYLFLVFFKS